MKAIFLFCLKRGNNLTIKVLNILNHLPAGLHSYVDLISIDK